MEEIKQLNDNLWENYMNCAYEFLECTPNTTITELREKFFYKIIEANREKQGCITYHDAYFNDVPRDDLKYNYFSFSSYKAELDEIHNDVTLLCDSYLAILLSKIDPINYKPLIEGLLAGWKYGCWDFFNEDGTYNYYFPLRFPREGEDIEMETPVYVNKEDYLKQIKSVNDYSTNNGFMRHTSSLSLVISIEENIMDKNQVIKKYRKVYLPIGRIVEKDQNKKRKLIINNYQKSLKEKASK